MKMTEYDAEGRNMADLKRSAFHDYELEELDKASLLEIERLLHSNGYATKEMVLDHLEFLEKLFNKLEDKQMAEGTIGYTNYSLMGALKAVENLRESLSFKMSRF